MKKLFSLVALFIICFTAAGQYYDSTKSLTRNNTSGFDWNNSKVRGAQMIPTDTFKLAVKDSGAIAYKNGYIYSYNGYTWTVLTPASYWRSSTTNNIDNSNTGNVGIGLTTPLYKLHVNGKGFFVDTLTATTMGTSDSSNRMASTAFIKRALATGAGMGYIWNGTSQQPSSNYSISGNGAIGGKLSVGATTAAASSVVDFVSTTKGFLLPRMTEAQRNAISSPANGLLVYVTDGDIGFWYYDGDAMQWMFVNDNPIDPSKWTKTGDAISSSDFLGTTNSQPLNFKVNNNSIIRIATDKTIKIDSGAAPAAPFDVSPIIYYKDWNGRSDFHITNKNSGNVARSGFTASNNVDNYVAMTVLGDGFVVPDLTDPYCWANINLYQSAGVGKNVYHTANEGNWIINPMPADSTDANIDYDYAGFFMTGASRHYDTRESAMGSIGIGNVKKPRAMVDIFAGELYDGAGDMTNRDYKQIFRGWGRMPDAPKNDFPAVSVEVSNMAGNEKNIAFGVIDENGYRARIDGQKIDFKSNGGDDRLLLGAGSFRVHVNGTGDNLQVLNQDSAYTQINGSDNYTLLDGNGYKIQTQGVEKFKINDNDGIMELMQGGGNVGIGLGGSAPATKLDVNGALKIAQNDDGFLSYNNVFGVHSNGFAYFQGEANGFIVGSNNSREGQIILRSGAAPIFPNSMQFYTNNAHAMTIASTGAVGIGTTSPTAVLHLKSGTATASTAAIKQTSGTLLTTIETGTMEYNNAHYQSNNALNRYANGGIIADFTSDGNNTGTGETDLQTYTTKASTLGSTGEKIVYETAGTFNDITATGQLQFYFAGTNIGNTGTLTVSATGGWSARVMIIRTGASTARSMVTVTTTGASTAVYTTETDLTGLTFTNTNIIKITGTAGGAGGGSSDITSKLGTILWWGAANN